MAKTDIWMPVYIGDYMSSTMHLTTQQHGAYLLLLMAAWKANGNLPVSDKKLSVIARLSISEWEEVKPEVLQFFHREGDYLVQKRLNEEIKRANSRRDAASENGKKGGRPPKKPKNKPIGNQEETHGFTENNPEHNPQESSSPSPSEVLKESDRSADQSITPELLEKGFEHFWKTWKDEKDRLDKVDTSPKRQTFEKKWKPYFKTTKTEDEFRDKVNTICQFVIKAHRHEGFNRFENMQTGKFFTERQWEDQ